MALVAITSTNDISTCGAFELFGETKIIAEGLVVGEYIDLYEENSTGAYQPVMYGGRQIRLEPGDMSFPFVGYGNYKALKGGSYAATRKVHYVA